MYFNVDFIKFWILVKGYYWYSIVCWAQTIIKPQIFLLIGRYNQFSLRKLFESSCQKVTWFKMNFILFLEVCWKNKVMHITEKLTLLPFKLSNKLFSSPFYIHMYAEWSMEKYPDRKPIGNCLFLQDKKVVSYWTWMANLGTLFWFFMTPFCLVKLKQQQKKSYT